MDGIHNMFLSRRFESNLSTSTLIMSKVKRSAFAVRDTRIAVGHVKENHYILNKNYEVMKHAFQC
jgi:hypothetical protein